MKKFINAHFLLQNDAAITLYDQYAKDQPIIDFHNHLPVQQIAENTRFENMAHVWLYGDHYKWRQMRTNGVDEKFCTGNGSDWEKFRAWAQTMPKLIGNPLYHWTHMELNDPFGINDRLLNPSTAQSIWDECNEKLRSPEFSSRRLLEHFDVRVACTTDDPADTLKWHEQINADASFNSKVLPTFRPDKGIAVENPDAFNLWVDKLESISGISISNLSHFLQALRKRHDDFHKVGCRVADHGLEVLYFEECDEQCAQRIFEKVRSKKTLDKIESMQFRTFMMIQFGMMHAEKNWAMQLHIGPLRNNNSRMLASIGPDTGFDSINDIEVARPLSRILDSLDKVKKLPKTILYNLNPRDNELLATMAGNFQDGSIPGKVQFGAAWWFLDQKTGIENQLDTLANLGLLSRFVGMLTDSRSFLSFSRHDYFRRILCNKLGTEMQAGMIPYDLELVGPIVKDICYGNARDYFGFDI